MQLIQQKLTERHLASSSSSPSSSSPASSALTALAPPLLNYRADVVWRAMQEEVQDMLSDYIQVSLFWGGHQTIRECRNCCRLFSSYFTRSICIEHNDY